MISLGRAGDTHKVLRCLCNCYGLCIEVCSVQVGYNVISAFTLDSGERVLVNRGWVPQSMGNANTRQEGQVVEWLRHFLQVFFRWLVNGKYQGCSGSQSRLQV